LYIRRIDVQSSDTMTGTSVLTYNHYEAVPMNFNDHPETSLSKLINDANPTLPPLDETNIIVGDFIPGEGLTASVAVDMIGNGSEVDGDYVYFGYNRISLKDVFDSIDCTPDTEEVTFIYDFRTIDVYFAWSMGFDWDAKLKAFLLREYGINCTDLVLNFREEDWIPAILSLINDNLGGENTIAPTSYWGDVGQRFIAKERIAFVGEIKYYVKDNTNDIEVYQNGILLTEYELVDSVRIYTAISPSTDTMFYVHVKSNGDRLGLSYRISYDGDWRINSRQARTAIYVLEDGELTDGFPDSVMDIENAVYVAEVDNYIYSGKLRLVAGFTSLIGNDLSDPTGTGAFDDLVPTTIEYDDTTKALVLYSTSGWRHLTYHLKAYNYRYNFRVATENIASSTGITPIANMAVFYDEGGLRETIGIMLRTPNVDTLGEVVIRVGLMVGNGRDVITVPNVNGAYTADDFDHFDILITRVFNSLYLSVTPVGLPDAKAVTYKYDLTYHERTSLYLDVASSPSLVTDKSIGRHFSLNK